MTNEITNKADTDMVQIERGIGRELEIGELCDAAIARLNGESVEDIIRKIKGGESLAA